MKNTDAKNGVKEFLFRMTKLRNLYKTMNVCTRGKCSCLLPTIGKDLKFVVIDSCRNKINYIAYAICKAIPWLDDLDYMYSLFFNNEI